MSFNHCNESKGSKPEEILKKVRNKRAYRSQFEGLLTLQAGSTNASSESSSALLTQSSQSQYSASPSSRRLHSPSVKNFPSSPSLCIFCNVSVSSKRGGIAINVSKCHHQTCGECLDEQLAQCYFANNTPCFCLCGAVVTPDDLANVLEEDDLRNYRSLVHLLESSFNTPSKRASTQGAETNSPEPRPQQISEVTDITFKCPICLETLSIENIFQIGACQHNICRECARNHILSLIQQRQDPKCPIPDCTGVIDVTSAEWVLKLREAAQWHELMLELGTVMCVHCTRPDCGGRAEIVRPNQHFVCPTCKYEMCSDCKMDSHEGISCAENRRRLREPPEPAVDVKCPGCGNGIEKNGHGCNHMFCIVCKTHFCFLCRKTFNSKKWEPHGNCAWVPGENDSD